MQTAMIGMLVLKGIKTSVEPDNTSPVPCKSFLPAELQMCEETKWTNVTF